MTWTYPRLILFSAVLFLGELGCFALAVLEGRG